MSHPRIEFQLISPGIFEQPCCCYSGRGRGPGVIIKALISKHFLGILGGCGCSDGDGDLSHQVLTGATLYAKNLFRPLLAPSMSDQQVAKIARVMVLVLTVGAVLFAIFTSASLVSLYLLGSAGVSQFFPGVVLGLFSKQVTAGGVFAGMASGIFVAVVLMLTAVNCQKYHFQEDHYDQRLVAGIYISRDYYVQA